MNSELSDSLALVLLAFLGLGLSIPLWLPIAFVAFAVGRRRFGLRLLMVLITVEGFALACLTWLARSGNMLIPIPVY
jgi:hypothetical protein